MPVKSLNTLSLLVLPILLATSGCGGPAGPDGNNAGNGPGNAGAAARINATTPCEKMIRTICSAACGCSDDCGWQPANGFRNSSTEMGVCYNWKVERFCGDAEMDFAQCQDAVAQAVCDDALDPATLTLTEACNGLRRRR